MKGKHPVIENKEDALSLRTIQMAEESSSYGLNEVLEIECSMYISSLVAYMYDKRCIYSRCEARPLPKPDAHLLVLRSYGSVSTSVCERTTLCKNVRSSSAHARTSTTYLPY
ncbi:hypothetical protein CEXT_251991 [Caerostris extrusa]|uniref:Uncharacterized protein n=1 Tax=Caerostris extrusa TaxID=172846 RepID=A0AAV4TN67_CAEEX|nr:hypothetical protein CEXT_251991 [Caerostris extrusa]